MGRGDITKRLHAVVDNKIQASPLAWYKHNLGWWYYLPSGTAVGPRQDRPTIALFSGVTRLVECDDVMIPIDPAERKEFGMEPPVLTYQSRENTDAPAPQNAASRQEQYKAEMRAKAEAERNQPLRTYRP